MHVLRETLAIGGSRFLAAMIVFLASAYVCSAQEVTERPNVVLIIGDDQAWGDFGFMGHPVIRTPNLDRLASESLVYTRGYVPSSLCRPSLSTIVTGLYAHQHRITSNDPPAGLPRGESLRQRARQEGRTVTYDSHGLEAVTRGCLGGTGFAFVSHTGLVQPCGYLEMTAGDVRQTPFKDIWAEAELFKKLRDFSLYKGKCGRCEYIRVCGGCRARAFAASGDFLAPEPLCTYQPEKTAQEG